MSTERVSPEAIKKSVESLTQMLKGAFEEINNYCETQQSETSQHFIGGLGR